MLKFCVLGSGISYTLSPLIHKTVFRNLGVKATYDVMDVPCGMLRGYMPILKGDYDGFNVTKPFKKDIMLYLDALDTKMDAVNVVKKADGRHVGDNTDAFGFSKSMEKLAGDVRGKSALILGAGGACEAAAFSLSASGADVTVLNRTYEHAEFIAKAYGVKAARSAEGLKPEILINCTSVGTDGVTSPIPRGLDLSALKYGYDLVYSPAHTAFMKECESAGAKTSNGLDMLVYQAIKADEIFLGCRLDIEELYKVAIKAVEKKLK